MALRDGRIVRTWQRLRGASGLLRGRPVEQGIFEFIAAISAARVPINVVFDIGAHTGAWTRDLAKLLPATTEFVLFEANPEHYSALELTGHRVMIEVLARQAGDHDFYSSAGTGDSLYRENTRHYDHVAPQLRAANTLSNVVAREALPQPDLIKLDTQGSELDILRGAVELLPDVSMLYLEMPILSYNAGAPDFAEYMDQITAWRFLPIGIFESHIAHGVLVQVDMLFCSESAFQAIHGAQKLSWASRLIWPEPRPST